jgi:hypothetical protein
MNSTDMQIMLDEMSRIINEMVNKNLYKHEHFTKKYILSNNFGCVVSYPDYYKEFQTSNRFGYGCGYIILNNSIRFDKISVANMGYEDLNVILSDNSLFVHGDMTYSSSLEEFLEGDKNRDYEYLFPKEGKLRNLPEDIENWTVFGFDTAHYNSSNMTKEKIIEEIKALLDFFNCIQLT